MALLKFVLSSKLVPSAEPVPRSANQVGCTKCQCNVFATVLIHTCVGPSGSSTQFQLTKSMELVLPPSQVRKQKFISFMTVQLQMRVK